MKCRSQLFYFRCFIQLQVPPKSVNQIWSRMKIFYKEEVTPIKIPIHNSRLKSTLDRMASGEVAIKAMPLTF